MRLDTGPCLRTVMCLPNPSGSGGRWMRLDTGACLRTLMCLLDPSGSGARWMRLDTGPCLRTVMCLPNPSGSGGMWTRPGVRGTARRRYAFTACFATRHSRPSNSTRTSPTVDWAPTTG